MSKIEIYYCSSCGTETPHVLVLVRKQSAFKNQKNQKFKEFIAGAIKGMALGSFFAAMDDFERHLICERCGKKIVES
ncbi:hypothetical protein BWI06_RS10145 [Vibrio parahaemolyticus]|uniref:hypothetical protein n=1 Tax=Vibrio parahaemolyticus TaxID=670 RepID=UPI00046F66DB|nr:hypothetical protein [Vibrio parahaemolyticus]EJE4557623.1 hypothetical protein [Vibrio parahaemolyticus]EJG1765681.1 hypothetical protein [Vibrio parahaemolyticus]ELA7364490.1 hypothetical protein [Vibrio parahaemolyticus]TOD34853.1 hypothetical protein CGJ65_24000 [Vibrio parahaemolyticus]HCE5171766.1 hypothetical protein [Vibrio parahaemolyticus]